jgi:hypothetical protein
MDSGEKACVMSGGAERRHWWRLNWASLAPTWGLGIIYMQGFDPFRAPRPLELLCQCG